MVHLERQVGFRVTKKEFATIAAAAKQNGMVVSRWIREICVAAAARGAHVEKQVLYDDHGPGPKR
jgi:hypothetical protein